jgi:hypothetical protein
MRQQDCASPSAERVPTQILHTEVIVGIPSIVDLAADAKRSSDPDRSRHRGTMAHVSRL